ncbi:MAG: TetR/AcrR family transcriptional regulator [Myxococcota bacterium]
MDSTLRVIGKIGYADATVADIERDAGLSPGAGGLYRHFNSKEELLAAAVRKYREEIRVWESVIDQIATDDPSKAIKSVPQALGKFASDQQNAIIAITLEGLRFPGVARQEVKAAYDDGYGFFADGLRKFTGPTEGEIDFEAAAIQMFAGIIQYVTQTMAFGAPPLGVTLDRYVASWLRTWSYAIDGWRAEPAPNL